ncbi:MAG: hypothetical protein ABIL44_02710 [candidate division WOR-3 bacterium]
MIAIDIPEEVYTMKAKRSIIKSNALLYRKASKKQKKEILDDLVKALHLHRKYITTLLNHTGKVYYTPQGVKLVGDPTITFVHKRGRKKKYTQELLPYLKALWVLSHYRSSIHLKAFITINQDWLFNGIAQTYLDTFPEEERYDLQPLKHIPESIKDLLKTISSATIERLLKPIKEQYRIARRYRPHPHASVLKKKIPIEPHFEKPQDRVGYVELDSVSHCGGDPRGEHCLTIGIPELGLGWDEYRAARNKAMVWAVQALEDVKKSVPYELHTVHPDGGTEVLNRAVMEFALKYGIRITRSRPYHKNDNPVVESRNFTLVRSYVGYCRYDMDAEYEILKELMPLISTLHNYFIPKMMLQRKVRVGGKVYKTYDIDTPYNRALNCPKIREEKKQELRERKANLSYFELLARIIKLQKKLDRVHRKRYNHGSKEHD